MPRVPELGAVQADSRVLTGVRADPSVDNASLAGLPGQQMQQMGAGLSGLGDSALRIATDMQNTINQSMVDGALNKMRETALNLTYDPQTGYQTAKGQAALQRDSGLSLADEYGQKLQQQADQISEGLGNEAQRRIFAMRANDIATSFRGNIEAHTLQEFKNYSLSVADGAIKLGQDDAKRNWSDPVKVDTNIKSVQAAVVNAGRLQGKSANQILSEMNTATSMVHSGVIAAALEDGNPVYAQQYLHRYSDQMTADDILKVNGAIGKDLDARVATQAVTQSVQGLTPRFQPTDLDRMHNITAEMESGGKDFNADGSPVTSKAGAKYTMQVMPATAANPGYGVAPAKDDSPAEYNRVGGQLLQALLKKYGNPAMAWAAYNAGAGNLEEAMKKADADGSPQNWLSYMPKETQAYVKNGMDKLVAGQGAPQMPTEQEFINDAVARLGSNPRPQQVTLTRQAAEHQYAVMVKSNGEMADQALTKIQQTLIANGGDFSQVPLDQKMTLSQYAPGKMTDAMAFAKRLSQDDVESDPELYLKLSTYPEEAAKMTDAQFLQLKTKLSDADFKHFSKERADFLSGGTDDGAGSINSKALNTVMSNRLTSIGIDPTPKHDDMAGRQRVGTIQKFVRDDIYATQQQLGKKLTPAELEQHVDSLFAKSSAFRTTLFGIQIGGTNQQPLLGMQLSDIPKDSVNAARAALLHAGVRNPTDDQVLRTYWAWKGKQ